MSAIADQTPSGYLGFDRNGIFVGRAYVLLMSGLWETVVDGKIGQHRTEQDALMRLESAGATLIRPERRILRLDMDLRRC